MSTEGYLYECSLRGKLRIQGLKATNPLTVGDRVDFEPGSGNNWGVITSFEARKNYIIRRSAKLSKQVHIIAANIDMAYLIVTLEQPRTSTGFIDRFLVTAEAYHIPATLVFNKTDIYSGKSEKLFENLKEIYTGAGYACMGVSALKGHNIQALKDMLANKINLFSGHSGVGKTALINAIEPGLNLKTGSISEYYQKGKHTTTFAEMICLKNGGYIIDTPGIKEFGLIDFKKEDLIHYFPELFSILKECRFYNCTHTGEPGCALEKAMKENRVSNERYKNYLNIFYGRDIDEKEWE